MPEDLKERVARAAERAGTSPRRFMLEVMAENVEHEQRRGEFQDTAEQRYAEIVSFRQDGAVE